MSRERDSERGRKESFKRIARLVTVAWRRCAYERWHTLSQHVDPLAANVGVAVKRKLEVPERRVDAHSTTTMPSSTEIRQRAHAEHFDAGPGGEPDV